MNYKFVERTITPIGRTRSIYNASNLHSLGAAFWVANWMFIEILNEHPCTYHFNGRLIARSATYLGV